jgi:beta-galactosidase
MYQSEWTNGPVLHLFPHWNWRQGDEVDVWAYSNSDEVELFLNGKSLGTKRKTGDEVHVMWKLKFEPGLLKAVSRTGGKVVLTREVQTAGAPSRLILSADRKTIKADGSDLSFVSVKVVDAKGNLVPYADNLVKFALSGPAQIAGVDNGSQISHEPFKSDQRKAFHGRCLAIIQAKEQRGKINLRATSDGLISSELTIDVR